jgi:hypothetical protein
MLSMELRVFPKESLPSLLSIFVRVLIGNGQGNTKCKANFMRGSL